MPMLPWLMRNKGGFMPEVMTRQPQPQPAGPGNFMPEVLTRAPQEQQAPPETGGLLGGGGLTPEIGMLLAMGAGLLRNRDKRIGEGLGEGVMNAMGTYTALKGNQRQDMLNERKDKLQERELDLREKQLSQPGEQWRLATDDERKLGVAAINQATGEPKMLPAEYATSDVETQRMMMDQMRLQIDMANQAANRSHQSFMEQMARYNATKPQVVPGERGGLSSVTPDGEVTTLREPAKPPLSAEELKQKTETQDTIAATNQARSKLQELKALNEDVPGGPTATIQKWWSWAADPDQYSKTVNFENLITGGMLDQLKTTFQGLGAMSNIDLQTFADAQASLSKPPEARAEIFRRMEEMIDSKMPVLQQRLGEITSGEYGRAQPQGASPPVPEAPKIRVYNPATGKLE